MIIDAAKCLFGTHSAIRRWNDGMNPRGECKCCRKPMIAEVQGEWRLFRSADAHVDRRMHPLAVLPQAPKALPKKPAGCFSPGLTDRLDSLLGPAQVATVH